MAEATPATPPGWDYRKYETKLVSLEDLDKVMAIVVDPDISWFRTIIKAIQLLAFLAYLWARKQLIDEKLLLATQEYEQSRVNRARDELGRDNLDTGVKP